MNRLPAILVAVFVLVLAGPGGVAPLSAQSRGMVVQYKESEAPGAAVAGRVELYSTSYALVVGIDNYSNGWPRLSNAVADARKVGATTRDHSNYLTTGAPVPVIRRCRANRVR